MATIYDTGDISLVYTADAVIAEHYWSLYTPVTLDNYAAKIVKLILEFTDAASGAITGSFCIFTENQPAWNVDLDVGGAITQPIYYTTSHVYTYAPSGAVLYYTTDTPFYVVNSDATLVKKIYLAYWNNNADTCKVKVRILYESLGLG